MVSDDHGVDLLPAGGYLPHPALSRTQILEDWQIKSFVPKPIWNNPMRCDAPQLLARQPRPHPAQRLFDVTRRPGKGQSDERTAVLGIEIDTGRDRYPGVGQQL